MSFAPRRVFDASQGDPAIPTELMPRPSHSKRTEIPEPKRATPVVVEKVNIDSTSFQHAGTQGAVQYFDGPLDDPITILPRLVNVAES